MGKQKEKFSQFTGILGVLLLAGGFALGFAEPISSPAKAPHFSITNARAENIIFNASPRQGFLLELNARDGANSVAFSAAKPLNMEVLDVTGTTRWLAGDYSTVSSNGGIWRCAGTIRTVAGSQFDFADTYETGRFGNTVLLNRSVAVRTPATNDVGFLTRFSLSAVQPTRLRHHQFFIPGNWYLDNSNFPPSALAASQSDEHILIREDRMPLPLIMMHNSRNGVSLSLIHAAPTGATSATDLGAGRLVDDRFQTASLGVFGQSNPALSIYYPGSEGERSYLARRAGRGAYPQQWVERFHPVRFGTRHSYTVLIDLAVEPSFPSAMRRAWRIAYATNYPASQMVNVDISAAYAASIQLISDLVATTNGASGIPFRLKLPQGELMSPEDLNFQMGFVGQQIPLAFHLLRYGLLNNAEEFRRKGEEIVDFWATHSLTPEGLPRTWFDAYPQPRWRTYNTFLRVATDGMFGALQAWDCMKANGYDRPQWLQFCRSFGDWLVKHQKKDGSWCREYDWSGNAVNSSPLNTGQAVPFLAKLYIATGQNDYRMAALLAGDWCFEHIHEPFAYVGGTPDNPNVMDKEAGYLALAAFLALHDLTGEPRWLAAATQAADFTETWAYSWNVSIPEDATNSVYPKGCPSTAFSLIAAGHSGADLFLAGAAFLYYRIYLATGDAHYAEMAHQFLHDTKRAVDIHGSLGYGRSGLCTEALTLAPPRGRGVGVWLPWITYNMIEPIVELQDTLGLNDAPILEGSKLAEMQAKNRTFARTRGLDRLRAPRNPLDDQPP